MRSRWRAALFSSLLAALCGAAAAGSERAPAALPEAAPPDTAAATALPEAVTPDTAAARDDRGPPVGRVVWEGLVRLDPGRVQAGSRLRTGVPLSDTLLDLEIARLDSLCVAAGLFAAEAAVDTVRRANALDVRVVVFEGDPARIGALTLTGSDLFERDEVLARLEVSAGAVFDPFALKRSMLSLLAELNNAGFPFAQVWITGLDFRPETGSVDLAFAVYGGEQTTVAEVTFEGLAGTDTTLARRISRLRKGRPYEERAMRRSVGYLISSGLFAEVRPARVERVGPGAVDIRIPVREFERRNSIQGVLGFSRREGGDYSTGGSVELDFVNVGGTGRAVSFRWLDDGERYRTTRARYGEPFFLRLPVGLSVEFRQDVFDTLYDFTLGGVDLTVAAGPSVSLSAGFTWDGTVPRVDEELLRSVRRRFRAGCSIRAGAAAVSARIEGARKTNYRSGAPDDAEFQFLYRLEGSVLVPALDGQAFFARAVAEGVVTPREVPPSETYPLGGARSLRGYRENQFRGREIAWVNLEYRFGGESRLFVFDDIGAFRGTADGWTVRNGFGFGLRSASKLGTVEMSFGVGERFALEQTRIHVALIENF